MKTSRTGSGRTRRFLAVAIVAAFAAAGCSADSGEEPESTATAVGAASDQGWCEGVDVRFFAGGSPGDGFAPILAGGAEQAGADLGANVDVVFSDWEPETMLGQLREAIAAGPDGIAFTGHPGDGAVEPLAEDAEAAGIRMMYLNVDVTEVREQFGGGYVGANLAAQGSALAAEALATLDLGSGDGAAVFGPWGDQARAVREAAVADAFEEAGLDVERLDQPLEALTDANLLTPIVTSHLDANPDTKVIVYAGTNLGNAPMYMDAAGKEPGEVFNIGFDLTTATLEAIQSGHVQITADQQPFLQGYLPVMSLCHSVVHQTGPLVIDTGSGFVTEENADQLAELVEQGIR